MSRRFSDLFPTPHFLSMPAVGMFISDEGIRCIELIKNRGKLKIKFFAEKSLASGVVESGIIKKPEDLINVLIGFREEHGLDVVNVALPEGQSYLFHLHIPSMKRSEIRTAIELQIEEHVPVPPAEALFDYEIIDDDNPGIGGFTVGVSALSVLLVESYLEVLNESGFRPLSFETEGQAMARSIIPRGDLNTHMIVYIGMITTSVCVVRGENVLFSSSISIGGDIFANALKKAKGITHEEAMGVLVEKGIGEMKGDNELFSTLLPSLSALKDEIGRRSMYWNSRKEENAVGNKKIDTTFISGPMASLSGIDDYLSYGLESKVLRANSWVNIMSFEDEVPSMVQKDSLAYSTVIGLALRNFDEKKNISISL